LSPKCIDVERIADLATLPDDHESCRHARECPRCRSLWLSYQSFMEAGALPGANVEAARRELEARIRRHGASAFPAAAPPASRLKPGRFWPAWLRPAPVLVAAAVLALVAITVWRGGEPEAPVLRGEDAGESALMLNPPDVSAAGIRLSWSPMPGADAYEVRFFDDALSEVYRAPAAGTELVLDRSSLDVVPGTRLTWRVVALRGGDVVGTSSPASLTMP